jgi:hypothetical protein
MSMSMRAGIRSRSESKRAICAALALGSLLVVAANPLGATASLVPNPANGPALLDQPIEGDRYDHADHCVNNPQPGAKAMVRWLEDNVRGELWGIVRCEKWGPNEYSVHAEGRAIDWHLDARKPAQRRAAMRLIDTLLATDQNGNPHALARRIGVQGLIFDCRSWWSGMDKMGTYSYCEQNHGQLDPTQAHRNHVHIELNWPGARMETSFWKSPLAG